MIKTQEPPAKNNRLAQPIPDSLMSWASLTGDLVLKTRSYEKFHMLPGNRAVNRVHATKIRMAMEKGLLFSPIVVNEKFEIIDGQHRFLSISELGLDLVFIIKEGYGLREVQILNSNNKEWSTEDYLTGWCDLGYPEYLKMRKFMEDYPDYKIGSTLRILTQLSVGAKQKTVEGKKVTSGDFEHGEFIIPDLEKSYEIAEQLRMLKPYFRFYNESIFVSAMLKIFNNPEYNHAEMLAKLKLQPNALIPQRNIDQYKDLIEDIYNWKRRTKVNLRY